MQDRRDRAGQRPRRRRRRGDHGVAAGDQENRGDRGAERQRAIRRDVGEREDPEADEDPNASSARMSPIVQEPMSNVIRPSAPLTSVSEGTTQKCLG